MSYSVVICAYNEETNIGNLLERIITDSTKNLKEILVISSSKDSTNTIVQKWQKQNKIIKLIREKERRGKSAAMNYGLKNALGDVIVFISADNLPQKGAIAKLIAPFKNPDIAATTARPIPLNNDRKIFSKISSVIWSLHHKLCLKKPKLSGELFAIRKGIVREIPKDSATDDKAIEQQLVTQNLKIQYVPSAKSFMKSPDNFKDFISQRRRIAFGYLQSKGNVVSQDLKKVMKASYELIKENPKMLILLSVAFVFEMWARFLAHVDFAKGKKHKKWVMIGSTKKLS